MAVGFSYIIFLHRNLEALVSGEQMLLSRVLEQGYTFHVDFQHELVWGWGPVEYSGYKLDAFYKLKPNLDASISSYVLMNKSANFELNFRSVLFKELTQVVNGKKTLDKATTTIQSSTQALADKLAKALKAKK